MRETCAYGSMREARSPKAEVSLLPLTRQHVALGTMPAHPCVHHPAKGDTYGRTRRHSKRSLCAKPGWNGRGNFRGNYQELRNTIGTSREHFVLALRGAGWAQTGLLGTVVSPTRNLVAMP
jgi:hypothetical protein